MAQYNTDFLRFSAYSMKDLITRKLSENSNFTDQIYEGSNLAILIDLVAYMYQCLIYQLNNAAAESMFSDTQIYENINRLVKMLGYNPHGCQPSIAQFYIIAEDIQSQIQIPNYSKVDTGLTDKNGKHIYYSITDINLKTDGSIMQPVTLYNGEWKLYQTVFTASGIDFETFVLDGLKSSTEDDAYIANDYIHVWVDENTMHDNSSISKWMYDKNEIFINSQSINVSETDYMRPYNGNDKVYSIRLNENKTYEIKFGNNITGRRLNNGDRVYIFYLDTNGLDGMIYPDSIQDNLILKNSPSDLGINQALYERININGISQDFSVHVSLISPSTEAVLEESVENIRENAPNAFKMGNRLITHEDYEYFVMQNRANQIISVKCHNNLEYITQFFKWLYYYGLHGQLDHKKSGDYYLNQTKLQRNNYKYADPADSNTIYIWTKTAPQINNPDIYLNEMQLTINNQIMGIKTLTTEIQVLNAISVQFAISCMPVLTAINNFQDQSNNQFDIDNNSYIEVLISDNALYINSNIQEQVAKIIYTYFDKSNCKLGMTVDFNNMLNSIMSLNGVQRVRTVYKDENVELIKNGLSFATWSSDYVEPGDDLDIGNQSRSLEEFQYPVLKYKSINEISSKIVVIKKSLVNINTIKY